MKPDKQKLIQDDIMRNIAHLARTHNCYQDDVIQVMKNMIIRT